MLGNGELLGGTAVGNNVSTLDQRQLPWDPTDENVNVQLDYFDGTVKFWAWQEGAERPITPHLEFDVANIQGLDTEGRIGIWIWNPNLGRLGPVEFQEVWAVPEPNAGVLILGAICAGSVVLRRHTIAGRLS
jgi:hypothetical protein